MSKVTTTIYVHANQEPVSWRLKPLMDVYPLGTQSLDLVDANGDEVFSVFLEVDQVERLWSVIGNWHNVSVLPDLADRLLGPVEGPTNG